jgi:hypothetical protein
MDMLQPECTWSKALIDFLASLRFIIFHLIIQSIMSDFGAVVPQRNIPIGIPHGTSHI